MAKIRNIQQILKAKPVIEGAGVHLKRALGNEHSPKLDPFLLFDDFSSNDPEKYIKGFPWHPHRGIETITYILKGQVEHGDSMGNKGIISGGDVQWMTAGSGIIHQEMPVKTGDGQLSGFQLWANLPASHKMMPPRYRDIKSADIPEVILEKGIKVKVICGKISGAEGPVTDIITEPEYLDITIPAGTEFSYKTPSGHTVMVYVISGKAFFSPENEADSGSLVHYKDGDELLITTGSEVVRFLLISGKPIGEAVAWYGPIVMNTREELNTAFREYNEGTFIK
jgi:redox-sensitive bicupin YhaK (pirin superfamily)